MTEPKKDPIDDPARGTATEAWERVDAVFREAVHLDGEARREFLDSRCGDDGTLRREVESLLLWAREGEDFTAWALGPQRWMAAELSAEFDRVQGTRLESGDNLGSYQLLREVGRGGMSRVFLAERADDQYHMQVAVKVIRPGLDSPELLGRLRQERQILAGLNHPHIAHLLDGGTTPAGTPFFVLEYVPGEPIDTYCDDRRLPIDACLELFLKVCGAVQYAHRNLIIHRDLKPSNLLVTADGEPKLLDFGIAKVLNPEAFSMTVSETQLGARLLTPEYASPEQFQGQELTTGTDVYSLGMILYRLLTGRLPFPSEGQTLATLERVVCEAPPPLPSQAAEAFEPGRGRALRGDLDRILLKALEKDPEARYGSVERFADDLHRYREGLPVSVRRPSLPYRARRFVRRHRTAFTAAAVVGLLLVAVVAYYTVRLRSERDAAQQLAERLTRTMNFVEEMVTQADPSATNAQEVSVRAVVDQMAERNEELRDEPALRAAVMNQVGRLYNRLALYDEAEAHLAQALEIRRSLSRQKSGAPDLDVADTAKELGNSHYYLGRPESAEALLTEAWRTRRRLLGEDDPLTVSCENDLSVVLENLGRLDEAEAHSRSVLEYRRANDPDSLLMTEALTNLGAVRWSQGKLEEAEDLYRQALEMGRRLQGPLHRDVTTQANNLAALLSIRGNHTEAEALFAEALAANRQLFGDQHPYVSRGFHRHARELRTLGRRQEAAADYREALRLHQEIAPEDPRITAWLVEFAEMLVEGDDCPAAAPLLEQALARSPEDATARALVTTCFADATSRSGGFPP
jgi:serine/threonine-protein kinase